MSPTRIAVGLVVLAGLIQLVPIDRENPPVESEVPAPEAVRTILQRSCYDCHSNQTRWPWYSKLAPVSWLVAHDVSEAREHLNFSTWNRYDPEKQRKKLDHAWEEVEEGDMPLWYYLPLHPDAKLADPDRELLHAWSQQP